MSRYNEHIMNDMDQIGQSYQREFEPEWLQIENYADRLRRIMGWDETVDPEIRKIGEYAAALAIGRF